MGAGDIVKAVYDGYKAGKKGKDLANFAVSIAGLEVADKKIDANITSYVKDKSADNTKRIKGEIINIRTFLRSLDLKAPGITDMKDLEAVNKYQVSAAISSYAGQLLFKINMAISSGNLPEIDDTPWSSRRAGYVRLRDGARIMALQFEAIVRNKQKELNNITEQEARLAALLASPQGLNAEDIRMINDDIAEQQGDEAETRRYLAMFQMLAKGAAENYQHFNDLIDTGDKRNSKK